MSWWRWTCSERGTCSFNLPRPLGLWAEETLFLSVYTFFWGLFSSPTLFAATVNNQLVHDFLSQQYNIDFFFSFWAYGFICGWPRPVSSRSAKQPGWRSPPNVTIVTINESACWSSRPQTGKSGPSKIEVVLQTKQMDLSLIGAGVFTFNPSELPQ